MKKVIKGKTYNTETATKIGIYYPYGRMLKLIYCYQYFKKKNGELFFIFNDKIYIDDWWRTILGELLETIEENSFGDSNYRNSDLNPFFESFEFDTKDDFLKYYNGNYIRKMKIQKLRKKIE